MTTATRHARRRPHQRGARGRSRGAVEPRRRRRHDDGRAPRRSRAAHPGRAPAARPRRGDDLPQPTAVRAQGGPLALPPHLRLRHGDLHELRAWTSCSPRRPTSSIRTVTPACGCRPGPLGEVLEGASRPGHFDGVLTVVGKLLHLTAARSAYFGQKDAQQLLLIRRMVRDLDFPVDVVSVPTVREGDGLAMSSRNMYLTASDREVALCLSRALRAGAEAAAFGPSAVRRAAREVLRRGTPRARRLPRPRPPAHARRRAGVVPRARRCSPSPPGWAPPGSSTTLLCSSDPAGVCSTSSPTCPTPAPTCDRRYAARTRVAAASPHRSSARVDHQRRRRRRRLGHRRAHLCPPAAASGSTGCSW